MKPCDHILYIFSKKKLTFDSLWQWNNEITLCTVQNEDNFCDCVNESSNDRHHGLMMAPSTFLNFPVTVCMLNATDNSFSPKIVDKLSLYLVPQLPDFTFVARLTCSFWSVNHFNRQSAFWGAQVTQRKQRFIDLSTVNYAEQNWLLCPRGTWTVLDTVVWSSQSASQEAHIRIIDVYYTYIILLPA